MPVVSDWQCFEMTGLLNYEDQVCAGGVGAEASACPGDSGGALQVGQMGIDIRIGIQLGRRLSQKQICSRSVVDLRVKVNKF